MLHIVISQYTRNYFYQADAYPPIRQWKVALVHTLSFFQDFIRFYLYPNNFPPVRNEHPWEKKLASASTPPTMLGHMSGRKAAQSSSTYTQPTSYGFPQITKIWTPTIGMNFRSDRYFKTSEKGRIHHVSKGQTTTVMKVCWKNVINVVMLVERRKWAVRLICRALFGLWAKF